MSKRKHLKAIKTHTGLVVGNYYIRALVNCYGKFWVEIFKVTKKPSLKNTWDTTKSWLFDYSLFDNGRVYQRKDSHVSDAIGLYKNGRSLVDYRYNGLYAKVLLPFSNKTYSYLKQQKTLKDFIQALNPGAVITEKMMDDIIFQFDMKKREKDEMQKHEDDNMIRNHKGYEMRYI